MYKTQNKIMIWSVKDNSFLNLLVVEIRIIRFNFLKIQLYNQFSFLIY